ncbi:hypothetical protein K438DRAFT_1758871 [Mycena galopus ATCC 62051]|nr:hypothetical protein K438DRAFT_1758871 [Mycena galopus ATCC 62051]
MASSTVFSKVVFKGTSLVDITMKLEEWAVGREGSVASGASATAASPDDGLGLPIEQNNEGIVGPLMGEMMQGQRIGDSKIQRREATISATSIPVQDRGWKIEVVDRLQKPEGGIRKERSNHRGEGIQQHWESNTKDNGGSPQREKPEEFGKQRQEAPQCKKFLMDKTHLGGRDLGEYDKGLWVIGDNNLEEGGVMP